MFEEGAAMKIIKPKNSLHSRRKTEQAMKDNKINSRSPTEADFNKRRSLKNRGTMKFKPLTISTPITVAQKISKTKHKITPLAEGYET